MLDEIAWLLNIRGSDIEYNPVVRSYVYLPDSGPVMWFLPQDITREMESEVRNHLELDSSDPLAVILPYEEIESYLKSQMSALVSSSTSSSIRLSSSQLNWRLYSAIESSLLPNSTLRIKSAPSLIARMKSVKNEAELNGMRQSHLRDGVALTAYLAWLDRFMKDAKEKNLSEDEMPTEYEVAEVLETFRQKMDSHISPSFATISSFGPNGNSLDLPFRDLLIGAVIHYKPKKESSLRLGFDSLYLCDSGAQYLDGTTDVTLTLHYGDPTQRMKDCFTLVLKVRLFLIYLKYLGSYCISSSYFSRRYIGL